MESANRARHFEQLFFGGLMGALAASLVSRFLILGFHFPPVVLAAMVACGAVGGILVTHYGRGKEEAISESFQVWNDRIRQFSLKVMLWMLALAAVIGVLTVLTASYDTLGRLAATVVSTAIAAGLLWPLSRMADRASLLPAGVLGMAATLIVYGMVIPVIWDLDHYEEEMIVSCLVIGFTTPLGMAFLALKNLRPMWIAARVGMVAWVAVLSLFLIATWMPGSYRQSAPIWETGWATAWFGTLAFASLAGLPRLVLNWRWAGVAASFLGWALALIGIWGDIQDSSDLLVVITSVAVVIGHAALALLTPLKPGQRWILWGTVAAVIFGAFFFDLETILYKPRSESILGRLAGAGGILASCGSLALVILAGLNRAKPRSLQVEFDEITSISLTCPQCGKKLSLRLAGDHCPSCGLEIHIQLRRPGDEEYPSDSHPNSAP